jgi:plastocyanin
MSSSPARLLKLLVSVLALCGLVAVPSASASRIANELRADAHASALKTSKTNLKIPVRDPGPPPGAQVLKYKFGPMKIQPGQNLIDIDVQKERPNVNGWIVGFRPGLIDAKTGKNPPVTEVHLHHAVWLVDFKPTFAAGEEKTNFTAPTGYGWRYTTSQQWMVNHMIHDLVGQEHEVYITYTLYFIPDTAPEAAGIHEIKTSWMDVEGVKPYPVFNALKGSGKNGKFTFPDDAKNPYPDRPNRPRNQWVVDHDATLVSTAGHLHPGGLWTDLNLTRDGKTVRLFRSRANYYEPSGAVSWDVAMSASGPNWRIHVKKGDILSTNATYDTTKASWYEVMGIMVTGITTDDEGGVDPFTGKVDETDYLTHGRLKENIDPAGVRKVNPAYHNAIKMRQGPFVTKIEIKNFTYQPGDLTLPGKQGRAPSVVQGKSLTFVNEDAPTTERFHTITACKSPCNKGSGIGFPLADGTGLFDSGELGYGPTVNLGGLGYDQGATPMTPVIDTPADKSDCAKGGVTGLAKVIATGCVGTTTWKTPKTLSPGTYTYFCRIHPFMRGAFKVVPKTKVKS